MTMATITMTEAAQMHTSVASAATQKTDRWEKCHSSAGGQKLHVQIRSQLGQTKVA